MPKVRDVRHWIVEFNFVKMILSFLLNKKKRQKYTDEISRVAKNGLTKSLKELF